jgi:hypothetical protein
MQISAPVAQLGNYKLLGCPMYAFLSCHQREGRPRETAWHLKCTLWETTFMMFESLCCSDSKSKYAILSILSVFCGSDMTPVLIPSLICLTGYRRIVSPFEGFIPTTCQRRSLWNRVSGSYSKLLVIQNSRCLTGGISFQEIE